MTDEADDTRAKLQQAHSASHRTAGTQVDERSARAAQIDTPIDEDIRRKAYEIWEARGRMHGRDREDWFEAKEALRQPVLPDGAPIEDAPKPGSDLISAGMHAAGSMILSAAHALDGLLGLGGTKKDPD